MAIRVRTSGKAPLLRFLFSSTGRFLMGAFVFLFLSSLLAFVYFYTSYARLVDEKLAQGPFKSTSMIVAKPPTISLGDAVTVEELVAHLRRCGYSERRNNTMGWFHLRPDGLEIFPGSDSFFHQEAALLRIQNNRVVEIIALSDNAPRTQYQIEPELITNLFDRNRTKRRLISFSDIPPHLVNAVIAIEDKRFFDHAGFDPIRILKAAYVDLREGRIAEGASTLTMQLAGSMWLDRSQRTWKRKFGEVLMTLHLERKLTKQQIFEFYANQIYLGQRGSFSIHGFGEGAQAFFAKSQRDLTLPEAALLAGLIQGPSRYNPYRYPDRARKRRDLVLAMMRDNGFITDAEYAAAIATPLKVAEGAMESTDAPYFVDLVNADLQRRFQDHDFQAHSYRVYTTLDLNLQRAASEAIRIGMKEVDERLRRQRRFRDQEPDAQVALVALDAVTGEVRALVGGRSYGQTQLNRALAKRQPGSAFKPFVFAAALSTALEGGPVVLTPISRVVDEPTTFWFDDKPYEPNNYGMKFYGELTLREALAKSVNIPTVKIAEMIGYDKVADLARKVGLGDGIMATPAIALGAYDATPLDVAGAYTIFADQGRYHPPLLIRQIRDESGAILYEAAPRSEQVLDPRVAFQMQKLLEEVINHGTGAGVRARGFTLPAGGKTGTSRDGWFAGFTSKLVCVVYVGFDDNRELLLEGAQSALPIWTEFMKRAHSLREYQRPGPFEPPNGIVSLAINHATGKIATSSCPDATPEYFIAGTQPMETCDGSSASHLVAGWEEPEATVVEPPVAVASQTRPPAPRAAPAPTASSAPSPVAKEPERKGFWRRILGILK